MEPKRIGVTATLMAALAACIPAARQTEPVTATGDAPGSWAELKAELLATAPDAGIFAADGPMPYVERENLKIRLPSGERLVADVIIPTSDSPTPLVVLVHGNHATKEAHRYQARRLASFGIETLVVQLPNHDAWLRNGRLLSRLVHHLHHAPEILEGNIDPDAIILAGHSFGGSAVTIAAGRGAPVKGLILLDPAVVGPKVKRLLPLVASPVMLLGADRDVFRARDQQAFYRLTGGDIGAVAVNGATHDDAQSPSMFALSAFGVDPFTSKARQETFTAALVASAFSLAATGKIDFAWNVFGELVKSGTLKAAHRRGAAAE